MALTSTRTLRPSGTETSISSARIVSPLRTTCSIGNSQRLASLPSARRNDIISWNCSAGRPGMRWLSPIRRASRLPAGTPRAVPLMANVAQLGPIYCRFRTAMANHGIKLINDNKAAAWITRRHQICQ